MKLTANQRKAVYGVVAAIATLSIAFGLVTAEELTLTVDSVTGLLTAASAVLGSILALTNITPDE